MTEPDPINQVSIDFDGTICPNAKVSHDTPMENLPPPAPGAKEFLTTLKAKGFTNIIFTVRAGTAEGKKGVEAYLRKHGLWSYCDYLTNVKQPCVGYVDDHGVAFSGDWLSAMKHVEGLVKQEKKLRTQRR